MTQTLTVSAPAKLFLLGEHAVVYDGACIITAVSARLFVSITPHVAPILILDAPDVGLNNYQKPMQTVITSPEKSGNSRFVENCIALFSEQYPIKGGLHITTRSEFNKDLGIGSSSAVVAATLFGLAELYDIPLSLEDLLEMGVKAIQQVQNLGSGADLAVAIYGGTIYYENRQPRVIKPLAIENLPIFAVWSGTKVSTVNLVQEVGRLYENHSHIIPPMIDTMLNIVDVGHVAFRKQDWQQVGLLMNIQQGLLEALGVNTASLADIVFTAREAGALGAKLSGAGGGDCAVVLAEPTELEKIQQEMREQGKFVVEYTLNAEGVRIED